MKISPLVMVLRAVSSKRGVITCYLHSKQSLVIIDEEEVTDGDGSRRTDGLRGKHIPHMLFTMERAIESHPAG